MFEDPLSWEQQEVFRLLKAQPGTMYQEDGTLRDMRCTLDQDKIPPQPPRAEKTARDSVDGIVRESQEVTKPEESHTQKVFDLDAGAWRSFRYDRLKKVSATMSFE